MKILIATGIYPPDVGGPATYAQRVAEKLEEKGDEVAIVTFSNKAEEGVEQANNIRRGDTLQTRSHLDSTEATPPYVRSRLKIIRVVRGNRILNRIKFFFAVYRLSVEYDIIYTLDWFAAGLPVALAAKWRRKPYVVRVGGDYLWEQRYLEGGGKPMTLADFYARGIYRRKKYAPFYRIIRFVLRGASHVIFNSDRQRELYIRFYDLSAGRVSTIYNPVPRAEYRSIIREKPLPEFIYWGRFIVMKNLTTLIRAFAAARLPASYTLTIIGDGPRKKELKDLANKLGLSNRVNILPPLPLPDVLERGKNCRAFILPSWTDISPNQVYESLAIGLPVLITKENYLSVREQFPENIDPNSVDDISAKLEMLASDAKYRAFSEAFRAISLENTWDDVMRAHLEIFNGVIQKKTMRVLQIGSDRSILDQESQSAARMREYGKRFGALDIIVFSTRRRGVRSVRLSEHARAYATNSLSRLLYPLSAAWCALFLPKPDAVSVQDPFEAGIAGWLIARAKGANLHVQVHTDFLSPEFARLSLLNRLRLRVAGFVLARAARIRVVSERIKKSIERRYHPRAPISVLPIFIDVARYRAAQALPALRAREHLFDCKFLVVSRLEPEKNVSLAISAFARAAIEKSCLIIIGDGSELVRLREFAEKKGVGKWVFFEGYADPAPYYKIADLVLFPSLYDGYGMVVVEALAAGTPVLATDVGIAREAGAIIAGEDDFAKAIKAWFENGPREGKLKNYPYENLDEYVRDYSNDILAVSKRRGDTSLREESPL